MDIHPADIIIYIINIAVLFTLLRLILWKPVSRFLSQRTEKVRSEFDAAEKKRLEAEAMGKEYSDSLADLEAQGRDILKESRIKAAEEAKEILDEARAKANAMILDARERVAEERDIAFGKARREIAGLATEMAASILKREVSPGDSLNAVEDFFREKSDKG